MSDFVERLNAERELRLQEADRITEQILQLQAQKDRKLAIASRIEELISFYGANESSAILVPHRELKEESDFAGLQDLQINTGSWLNPPYSKLLEPEYKNIPIIKNVINYLASHSDEAVHINVLVRYLGKQTLSSKDSNKLKAALYGACSRAVAIGLCYRVDKGVYTLSREI